MVAKWNRVRHEQGKQETLHSEFCRTHYSYTGANENGAKFASPGRTSCGIMRHPIRYAGGPELQDVGLRSGHIPGMSFVFLLITPYLKRMVIGSQ